MYFASWRIRPSEPVLETRSEPAKSTRCSFDLYIENHNHLGLFVSTDSVVCRCVPEDDLWTRLFGRHGDGEDWMRTRGALVHCRFCHPSAGRALRMNAMEPHALIWHKKNVSILVRCPLYQGLNCMQELFFGKEKVSLLERCPHFRSVLRERFHCMTSNDNYVPLIKSVMKETESIGWVVCILSVLSWVDLVPLVQLVPRGVRDLWQWLYHQVSHWSGPTDGERTRRQGSPL